MRFLTRRPGPLDFLDWWRTELAKRERQLIEELLDLLRRVYLAQGVVEFLLSETRWRRTVRSRFTSFYTPTANDRRVLNAVASAEGKVVRVYDLDDVTLSSDDDKRSLGVLESQNFVASNHSNGWRITSRGYVVAGNEWNIWVSRPFEDRPDEDVDWQYFVASS